MSGTSRACGETSSTCTSAAVKSAFGLREPVSYYAKRTSALLSGKPTAVPRYFCVIPRRSLKKWILSPIAIVFTLLAYVSVISIRTCQAPGSIFCENLHPLLLDRTLNWSSIHSTTSIADMFSESQEKMRQKSLIFSCKPLGKSKYA